MRPILLQGAHPPEVSKLIEAFLPGYVEENINGFQFWVGSMLLNEDPYPVVVSITGIGLALAAASVAIAKQHFDPLIIVNQGIAGGHTTHVNQGIAGGHTTHVNVGDIIIGEYCINMNAFKTPFVAGGGGSNSLTWKPKRSRGSGGGHQEISPDEDLSYIDRKRLHADEYLLKVCKNIPENYMKKGKKILFGGIGTSETWNSEVDRIQYLHMLFGTLCEEMEASAVAQIAQVVNIPFISIRIISNNIMNAGIYDVTVCDTCQLFVIRVIEAYLRQTNSGIEK